MKKLLTLLLFIPVIASAQKIELSLSGGYNAQQKNNYNPGSEYISSLSAALKIRSLQLGISGDVIFGNEYLTTSINNQRLHTSVKPIVVVPRFFANKVISILKVSLHGGVTAGMHLSHINITQTGLPEPNITEQKGQGLVLGIQVGGGYYFNDNIGVFCEVSGRYNRIRNKFTAPDYPIATKIDRGYLSLPVMIGVKYKVAK